MADEITVKEFVNTALEGMGEDISELSKKVENSSSENAKAGKLYKSIESMINGVTVTGVCYGDSITWGQDPTSGKQSTNPYPSLLQANLRKIYGGETITITNKGVAGKTSEYGLENIDETIALEPNFIIIMYGTNDCTAKMEISTFKDNIKKMVDKCTKANIEVLLVSCHQIFKTDDKRNLRQKLYAQAMLDVANELGIASVDLYSELNNYIGQGNDSYVNMLGDSVHFTSYKPVADIICGKALINNVLENESELELPLWHNPYIFSDLVASGEYATKSKFTKTIGFVADGSLGTYIRLPFFCNKKGFNFGLYVGKSTYGGQAKVLDNGVEIATIDCFSKASIQDVQNTVLYNISYGMHVIEILNTGVSIGKATTGAGKLYLSGIKFEKNTENSTQGFNSSTSLINGSLTFTDSSATDSARAFIPIYLELKKDKTLVIDIEGTLYNGCGIAWMANKSDKTEYSGYATLNYDNKQTMQISDGTAYSQLGTAQSLTIDYSSPVKVHIEHSYAGEINITVNGNKIITQTDTNEIGGYVGLYSGKSATGTATITKAEYSYI